MTSDVINLEETRRRRSPVPAPEPAEQVTPRETLDLVRAYTSIKDPEVRQIALEQLKTFSDSQN
jgi:hypothetical protein